MRSARQSWRSGEPGATAGQEGLWVVAFWRGGTVLGFASASSLRLLCHLVGEPFLDQAPHPQLHPPAYAGPSSGSSGWQRWSGSTTRQQQRPAAAVGQRSRTWGMPPARSRRARLPTLPRGRARCRRRRTQVGWVGVGLGPDAGWDCWLMGYHCTTSLQKGMHGCWGGWLFALLRLGRRGAVTALCSPQPACPARSVPGCRGRVRQPARGEAPAGGVEGAAAR